MKMSRQHVFPTSCIKQVLQEYNMKGDDDIMILSIQSNLLTNLLIPTVKAALISCIHSNRKYINTNDILFATRVSRFTRVESSISGHLLQSRQFGALVHEHIHLLSNLCLKTGLVLTNAIKISTEVLIELQKVIESYICDFMQSFSMYCTECSKKSNVQLYLQLFSKHICNDISFLIYDDGYSPYTKLPCDRRFVLQPT